MPQAVGFRVEGLNKVVRDLQTLGVEVDDLKAAFAVIALEGAEHAAAHAPKKSGALSRDIRGNRAKSKAVVTAGRKSVPYAGPINYSWPARHIEGSFFMQKADEEMQPIAIQRLEDEINRQIRLRGLH